MAVRFHIEQIALNPPNVNAARELLAAMGLAQWVEDHVVAEGRVFGMHGRNHANLAFNYDAIPGGRGELELLDYVAGPNWLMAGGRTGRVSHLGMHCTAEELDEWKGFFAKRKIPIAQEVATIRHTNPAIADTRWYHYCIFDTHRILGVDIKFIVRLARPLIDEYGHAIIEVDDGQK